ncbi:O-antigen ligase family protein [Fonticella tunisiensis]|uniref:Putative inorganic carbon (HCO3(-)) transporter n=1 Tax=Fonticella tunisiensis TaxID=1096341 RepID=A0A4R7KUL2_9CLOT|nr:O-antigen ligase family protein [Fonticella tunisiensis]TDT61994.1 putative inorganic carbon (HCO3(-)) transporter [Fonticella tunisiensis]
MLTRVLNLIFILIICIVPLIITPWAPDYYYYPKIIAIYALAFILAVISIFLSNSKTQKRFEDIVVVLYLLWITLSTLFSIDINRAFLGKDYRYEGLLSLTCYILIYLTASKFYSYSKKHVPILIVSSVIICIYGIIQYFNFDPIPSDGIRTAWERYAYSTTGNPNFLGSYIVLILPVCIFCYIISRKYAYLFSSGILYMALLCTRTRSAWIGGVFSGILLIILIYIRRIELKPMIYILILFSTITLGLNYYSNHEVKNRFVSILSDAKAVATKAPDYERAGSTRIFIWKKCLKLIATKPIFGFGPDTLDILFMKNFYEDTKKYFGDLSVDKAHNEYIQIAASSGLPAAILYLTFVGAILFKSFKNFKKNILIIPLLCSISGYLIQAFFNISVVSVAPVYWGFLGILSGMAHS